MLDENRGSLCEIQFCGWMTDIYPWIQKELETPFWRLYWSLTPGGRLRVGNDIIVLPPETFILIPAGLRFSTFAEEPFEQFFIHFNFNDLVNVTGDRIYTIEGDGFSSGYIREFVSLYQQLKHRLRCEMIGYLLLNHALLKSSQGPVIQELPSDRRIVDIVRYISVNLASPLENELLARRCGMARNAFIRLFSQTMRESPQAFVRRKRIDRACRLLHFSGLSLKEIAMAVGFADQYHFSKVFSHLQHNTPKKFRDSYAEFQKPVPTVSVP